MVRSVGDCLPCPISIRSEAIIFLLHSVWRLACDCLDSEQGRKVVALRRLTAQHDDKQEHPAGREGQEFRLGRLKHERVFVQRGDEVPY